MESLNNPYVIAALTILITMYAASIRPELPPFIKQLFNNPLFRIVILFLVVVRANKNPTLALMIAIGFTLTVNFITEQEMTESFRDVVSSVELTIPSTYESEDNNHDQTYEYTTEI